MIFLIFMLTSSEAWFINFRDFNKPTYILSSSSGTTPAKMAARARGYRAYSDNYHDCTVSDMCPLLIMLVKIISPN